MVGAEELWKDALPAIREGVTGVGVWTALNAAQPILLENDQMVIGLPHGDNELAGHLRLPQTRRIIEQELGLRLDSKVALRVIEGTTEDDWEVEKRRDAERKRLQEQALARAKKEVSQSTSWDSIYDQLSRRFSATPNRSLPQNRARFFLEAVEIVATALQETPVTDDYSERQFARCLERISQYTELPSTMVAVRVLEKTFAG